MRISDWSSDVCSSDLAGLRTGHLLQLHIDFLAREVTARRAIDETPLDPGREQPPVLVDRTGWTSDAQDDRKRVCLAVDAGTGVDADNDPGPRKAVGRQRSAEHTSELQSLMRISY